MLTRNAYYIRERVGLFRFIDTWDILDPDTKEQIGIAKEKVAIVYQLLRRIISKITYPAEISVYKGNDPQDESQCIFSIKRGFTFLRYRINILDRTGNCLGYIQIQNKRFSLGNVPRVYDAAGNEIARITSDWKRWTSHIFTRTGTEIGVITKEWAGLGKECFTLADNYVLALKQEPDPAKTMLLLATGLMIDRIF